jgi:protoporphyrinogen oxidase
MLDAVIVGGGIAGLASAWDLRNRDILVLEASDRLGGRIRSEARGRYWLNLGAHVFSGRVRPPAGCAPTWASRWRRCPGSWRRWS